MMPEEGYKQIIVDVEPRNKEFVVQVEKDTNVEELISTLIRRCEDEGIHVSEWGRSKVGQDQVNFVLMRKSTGNTAIAPEVTFSELFPELENRETFKLDARAVVGSTRRNFTATDIISLGWNDHAEPVNKFGKNAVIGVGTEDIISIGGTLEEFTAATTVTITPAHADEDAVGGDGMRTVTLEGLDANYALQEGTFILDGVTPVVTTGYNWRFIYRAEGATYGDNGTNTGIITFKETAGNDIMRIDAAAGKTLHSAYMIPAGYTGLLKRYYFDIESAPASSGIFVFVKAKKSGAGYNVEYEHFLQDKATRSWTLGGQDGDPTPRFPEKTIIKLTATSDINSALVTGGFDMTCFKNSG